MEKTDSLEAHKAEVVQLREKVASLEERASTEQRHKESCQGEIERLSRQVRLAEGKASHWEEAAREIHTPKHQRQRRGSKGGSSSVSVGAEDVDVSDGAVELRVQMAELKGRNSELHSRLASLENQRQALAKTLDEKNVVIEALQKDLVASKISLVSVKSALRVGSQPAVSPSHLLTPSQVSSPQHAVAASSVSSVPPAPLESSSRFPSSSSAPLPVMSTALPHNVAALQDHLVVVLKDLRSKEEALGKCQEELEQFRRKFSVIIHQQVCCMYIQLTCTCTCMRIWCTVC